MLRSIYGFRKRSLACYSSTHLDALISAATVAPAFPALLHGGVVVALIIVTCRGVQVSVDRYAIALVLFKPLVHVAFTSVRSK